MKPLRILIIALSVVAVLNAACPGERFDITIKEPIALSDALLSIIDECDVSLDLDGEGTERKFRDAKVGYVSLRAVNADEAIDFLLQRANLHHKLNGDQLVIRNLDTKVYKLDYINNSRTGSSSSDIKIGGSAGSSSSGGSSTSSGDSSTTLKTEETIDFSGDLDKELASVLSRPEDGASGDAKSAAAVLVNSKSGLVTVTGTRKQLDRVTDYLNQTLKSLKKQVLIDVQILSVELVNDKQTGIDWGMLPINATGAGSYDYTYNQGGSNTKAFNFGSGFTASNPLNADGGMATSLQKSFINFLQTQGTTKSLSNPKVLTMNNQPTLISVGDTFNYLLISSATTDSESTQTTEQESSFVGVLLDITPQIDDDGYITLRINPSYSYVTRDSITTSTTGVRTVAPDTKTNNISSVVRVRDGETVVLGGLISTEDSFNERKMPILGDLPFLGKLFGSKTKHTSTNEIVFVLTPHIITDEKAKPSLKTLGFTEDAISIAAPVLNAY